eukprot:2381790-Prorocentrum_lima.AAC.1
MTSGALRRAPSASGWPKHRLCDQRPRWTSSCSTNCPHDLPPKADLPSNVCAASKEISCMVAQL